MNANQPASAADDGSPAGERRPDADPDERTVVSRKVIEIVAALLVIAFGALIVIGATEHNRGWGDRGPEPGYFPFWIGLIIIAGGIGVLSQTLLKSSSGEVFLTRGGFKRLAAFSLPMVAFVALSIQAGFYAATMTYLLFVMIVQGGYRIASAFAVSLGTTATFFLLFEIWLRVPLLKGALEALVGIH